MQLTGHKTEAVYRRCTIVAEGDLREAGAKLAATLGLAGAAASLRGNSGGASVTVRAGGSLRHGWWAGTGLNRRDQDFPSAPGRRTRRHHRPTSLTNHG